MDSRDQHFYFAHPLGRLVVRWHILHYDLMHTYPQDALRRLVWRLPYSVIYWCLIRACVAIAGPDRHPDSVTVVEALDVFEGRLT